jgi:elongation factor G
MPVETSKVRTIAVVGHAASGKTSLIDAALFLAKAVPARGRVANGSSVADYLPDETERKITIHAKPLHCAWRGHQVFLLDTPGFSDFWGEPLAALRAADAAIVVVDAIHGVDVGTRRLWRLIDELKLPRLIFTSKLDKENSDFARTVEQIQTAFGKGCVPIALPVGREAGLKHVAVLSNPPAEPPEGFAAAADQWMEAAAEHDDGLLEKYLGGEKLSGDEISKGARAGVLKGVIAPIY